MVFRKNEHTGLAVVTTDNGMSQKLFGTQNALKALDEATWAP